MEKLERIIAPNGKLWSEMKKKTKKRVSRTGKAGIVRLRGADKKELREQVYDRAQGMCELKLKGCKRYAGWKSGHLAHIQGTGAGGSDTPENTNWSCDHCHFLSHAYGKDGQKPCPRREKA